MRIKRKHGKFQRAYKPYKEGELEVILSVSPTPANVFWLSKLLERSEEAIKKVYQIAFEQGPFAKAADPQQGKIVAAKRRVEAGIGRSASMLRISSRSARFAMIPH